MSTHVGHLEDRPGVHKAVRWRQPFEGGFTWAMGVVGSVSGSAKACRACGTSILRSRNILIAACTD